MFGRRSPEKDTQQAEGDPRVWIFKTLTISAESIRMDYTIDAFDQDEDYGLRFTRAFERAQPVPQGDFPTTVRRTGHYQNRRYEKHFFLIRGIYTVSPEAAEVLRQYDLGATVLQPVTVLDVDGSPTEEQMYFLNIRETRELFEPEHSRNFKELPKSARKGSVPLILSHGDIAVSRAALEKPELWIDPSLLSSMFMSGELAKELMDKKLLTSPVGKRQNMARCVVIE